MFSSAGTRAHRSTQGQSALSRRTLLAGTAAVVIAAGAPGCSPARAALTPDASALVTLEQQLIAACDVALAAMPDSPERKRIARRRLMHVGHAQALGVALPTPATSLLVTAQSDSSAAALMNWIAFSEREASRIQRAIAIAATDTSVARIAALAGACERTHGVTALATLSRPARFTVPENSAAPVLREVLNMHYLALWAIPRLGPLLSQSEQSRAKRYSVEHTMTRDHIRRAMISMSLRPQGPAATYSLSRVVRDSVQARIALRDLERAVAVDWLDVFTTAGQDAATRAVAVDALGDAAVRATGWGNAETFPGFGDVLRAG